jgi:hypothetical protein
MPVVKAITKSDYAWRKKVDTMIGELSRYAFDKANRLPNGTLRRKPVPYDPGPKVRVLVEILDTNDEERAKRIFHHGWAIAENIPY